MNHTGRDELTSPTDHSAVTNQTKVDSVNNCEQADTSANIFFITVYSLVFLVGLPLNGFIVKFYFCQTQRQTSTSTVVYLKNLAVADFLLCLCLPIRISKYTTDSFNIHLVYCSFGFSVFFLNMYASILFMGYIAATRYVKIVYGTVGTHILQTVQAARIISIVTWVFLLALTSTHIIMSFHTPKPSKSVSVRCEVLRSGQLKLLFKIILACSTIIFLFVLVSMVFFYYKTSRKVSLAQQRHPATSSSKKLAKSHRNMVVLVCVFCFCFVPFHLVRLPSAFLVSYCSWRKALYYLMEVSILMSVLNVCLDPLIYFIFCKSFRAQFSRRVVTRNQ